MQKKIEKLFFSYDIITFELVALNTRFYWERMLVIGCQYVNKQSQISDTTKTEFLELIFFHSNKKIWQKYCCADLCIVSDRFTCWLCISVLRRGFFGI